MPILTFSLGRIETPTGQILVVTDDRHCLRAVDWSDRELRMHTLLRRHYGENAVRLRDEPGLSGAARSLLAYFEGDLDALAGLPTVTGGTDFQRAVWGALRRIPVGQTTSYGGLAAMIGRPEAIRAVGRANGANPIPIVVPCHRVIGADAALVGFSGGIGRKRWLLAHEGVRLATAGSGGGEEPAPGAPRHRNHSLKTDP